MQSAVPSTMSRGPASLYKQARRAGKPLNLSSPIVCTAVDRWLGALLWRGAVRALRLRRNRECRGPTEDRRRSPARCGNTTVMYVCRWNERLGRGDRDASSRVGSFTFSGISSVTAILSGREAISLTFDPTGSTQACPPVDHQQEAPFLATVSCWGVRPPGEREGYFSTADTSSC